MNLCLGGQRPHLSMLTQPVPMSSDAAKNVYGILLIKTKYNLKNTSSHQQSLNG